jgi:hypothetical protein
VDLLAKTGFNSIRLPMHYNLFTLPIEEEPVRGQNTWLTTGFTMTDDLLAWCQANQMYLILDLHAAPGGHPVTKGLPATFKAAPNEWYKWACDLRTTHNIKVLLSIDPAGFPLGTGPKPHEIWHRGYHPVVWTNPQYRMLYVNMWHNDIDYENKTNRELSLTFDNEVQNQLRVNALEWLGTGKQQPSISGR